MLHNLLPLFLDIQLTIPLYFPNKKETSCQFQEARIGKIASQVKSELKQLPFMLGKLLGGIMAVVGFTAAVVIITKKAGQSLADILPFALLGGSGIIIFVLSSRLLAKRLSENPAETLIFDDRTRMSMLPWIILLLIVAVFLFCTYLITR